MPTSLNAEFATGVPSSLPSSPARTWPRWVAFAAFSVLWIDLIRQLSTQWDAREQYAYGWFVPFFALALFLRRWLDRPPLSTVLDTSVSTRTSARKLWSAFLVCALAAILPLRVVYEINPDWPLVAWAYALITVGITLHLIYAAGGTTWLKHFAFPVAFILVAVVWPYRIEKGLTQGLMRVAASITVELLGWMDVPALARGNLIELSTGTLGVDEACSGIRSFQSSLMAALLMGELYRFGFGRRLFLVACSVTLGFCFNIVRTLLLSWQANAHGIGAIDKWHDPAGVSIAVACFVCLWGLALLIKKSTRANDAPQVKGPVGPRSGRFDRIWSGLALAVGCWVILSLLATEVWYRSHVVKDAMLFHWSVQLPDAKPTFQRIELASRTVKLLAYDSGAAGKWADESGWEWSAFFFQWNPRSIKSVIQARVHRPEVCLPASGFKQLSESELVYFDAGPLKLPFRKYSYSGQGQILYVFFCQWEDGSERQTGIGASAQTERLRTVWAGLRNVGQQTLEIIITGAPSLDEAENTLRRQLPGMIQAPSQANVGGL